MRVRAFTLARRVESITKEWLLFPILDLRVFTLPYTLGAELQWIVILELDPIEVGSHFSKFRIYDPDENLAFTYASQTDTAWIEGAEFGLVEINIPLSEWIPDLEGNYVASLCLNDVEVATGRILIRTGALGV